MQIETMPGKGRTAVYTIVLLIEQALDEAETEQITALHEDEETSFIVLLPIQGDSSRLLESLDDLLLGRLREAAEDLEHKHTQESAQQQAQQALETTLLALRRHGAAAEGALVPQNPIEAVQTAVAQRRADEVIIMTRPHLVEEFFHRDWASRARHAVPVPVLRLIAHTS
jgi:hypothetical protein